MTKDPRFDPKLLNSKKGERKEDKITSKELANSSILSNHLADSSVTSDKIVNGSITDAKMTTGLQQRLANTFVKKQIVHRRILQGAYGSLSGNLAFTAIASGDTLYANYTAGSASRFFYGPYSYGAPSVQPGAERRTRIYAIWSDNIQNQIGYFEVRITIVLSGGAGTYAYSLGWTWGDTTTTRDGYSNEIVGLPSGAHGTVYFHLEGSAPSIYVPAAGAMWYAELQHLDVFP